MRLIIEIIYHSSALAVSADRFDDTGGEGRQRGWGWHDGGMTERRVSPPRRRVRTYARRCVRADRVLFVRIAEPRTLISRFREIIRGGCVISFLVISCSTRRAECRVCMYFAARNTYSSRVCSRCARIPARRGCCYFRTDDETNWWRRLQLPRLKSTLHRIIAHNGHIDVRKSISIGYWDLY